MHSKVGTATGDEAEAVEQVRDDSNAMDNATNLMSPILP
jgi:hypothetical protein